MNRDSGRDPVIVGIGMMTAIGLSAAETAASVQAGTMRFAESAIVDRRSRPFTLAEVPEDGLPGLAEPLLARGLTARAARMLRLATMPLRECTAGLPERLLPLPLALALPETETPLPLDTAAFVAALASQVTGVVEAGESGAAFRGRAGGIAALGLAADAVRTGRLEFVIAGGVDSFRDLHVLGTLDVEGRVKSADNLDGFIPGEGAAFVLLASRRAALGEGLEPLASIAGSAEADEAGHLYSEQPYRGEGLAQAVARALAAGPPATPIHEVYASMNGEAHWAKEWGVTFIRNQRAFAPDHRMHHPADCFGDTGAACGPLLVGLAARALADGQARTACLAYASSDRGARAAILMEKA